MALKIISKLLDKRGKEDLPVDQLLDTNGSTITDLMALNYANKLDNAMIRMGTDEDAIEFVFDQLKNESDFNKVYNKFGLRQYSSTWGNIGDPVTSNKRDLIYILNQELSESLINDYKIQYSHLGIW